MTGWVVTEHGRALHAPSCPLVRDYSSTAARGTDRLPRALAAGWLSGAADRHLCGKCRPSDPRLAVAS